MSIRIIISIFAFLSLQNAFAADMRVIDNSQGDVIEPNEQYFTRIKCEQNTPLTSQFAREYIRRIDEDGNYHRSGPVPYFFAKEVLHGFMLFSSKPTITATEFSNGTYQVPANSYFVPLFHIKREGNRISNRVVSNRIFDGSLCDIKNLFLMGDNEHYIVPYFMYTDVGDDNVSLISAILGLVNDIANPLQVLLGDKIGSNLGNKASNLKTVVDKISEFVAGPNVKVVLDNPMKIREGSLQIASTFTTVTVYTSRDQSFLRGSSPFRDAYEAIFKPIMTTNDLSDFANINQTCDANDNLLRDAGLRDKESKYDRAYILHRFMRDQQRTREETLHCLLSPRGTLGSAAVDEKVANLFYREGERPFTSEEIVVHLRNHPELKPQEDSPNVRLTESVLSLKIRELADIHSSFTPVANSSSERSELGRIAERAEAMYFMPKITVLELKPGSVLSSETPNFPNGSFSAAPFEAFRNIGLSSYAISDCLLQPTQIENEFVRSAVFGQAKIGFLFIKPNEDGSNTFNSNNVTLARTYYSDNGTNFAISKIELLNNVREDVLMNAICVNSIYKGAPNA